MTKEKKFKGKLTIGRWSDGSVSVTISDLSSGIEFVDARMTVEDFGNCVLGMSMQDCEFSVRGCEHIGKIREHKTEKVHFAPSYKNKKDRELLAEEAIKHLEVDGWHGDSSDLLNHHRWCGQDMYTVSFSRLVDTKEETNEK